MGATADRPKLQWRGDWRTTLFAVLCVPLFVALGNWQLGRADEKQAIAARFEARSQAGPVPIAELRGIGDDLAYRRVRLTGSFDNGRPFLLDNRVHEGRYGFEVLSPFILAGSSQVVLVNRGWIAGDPARRSLPEVAAVEGERTIEGSVYVPPGQAFTLESVATGDDGWPRVIQVLEVPRMADSLETMLYPYSVRLSEGSAGALTIHWPVVNVSPDKHRGYAVQWFAMAVALSLLFLWRSSNIGQWLGWPAGRSSEGGK
jgi:cytochrome oxidase assembly protein ShyY1